jgi:hypothetical protein
MFFLLSANNVFLMPKNVFLDPSPYLEWDLFWGYMDTSMAIWGLFDMEYTYK